jgi:NADH dehydrogenase
MGDAVGRPRVVIVGAGFGGLAAAQALGGTDLQVTVVDRLNYHLFQPLLYQVAMAGLSATDVAYPIRRILRHHSNIEVLLDEVRQIDLTRRRVHLADGIELAYDYLIIAAGAETSYFGHDDWAPVAPGLKDLEDAFEVRRRVLSALEAAERTDDPEEKRRLLTFVVVGGGPTGVELAGAIADLSREILHEDFRRVKPSETRVVLVEMADRILTPFEPKLSESARLQLNELRVEVRVGVRVERIDRDGVLVGGEVIQCRTVLWAAGVRPNPLAAGLGAARDRAGRIIVEADCSVPGHREVFVIGDMAALTPAGASGPLPGISPVAIQEGRAAARNILRAKSDLPSEPFHYFDKGFMATIGKARAVARLGRLRLTGFIAWLAWVLVHLWFLIGFRNRVVVFVNWIWAYVISSHGARIISARSPPPDAGTAEPAGGDFG